MSRYAEFDVANVTTQSIARRHSRVPVSQFAQPPCSGASFAAFLASLPHIEAGNDIRTVASALVEAQRRGRAVVAACGGHVVKCGLTPVLIDWMERGLLSALAIHGAVAVHEVEWLLPNKAFVAEINKATTEMNNKIANSFDFP